MMIEPGCVGSFWTCGVFGVAGLSVRAIKRSELVKLGWADEGCAAGTKPDRVGVLVMIIDRGPEAAALFPARVELAVGCPTRVGAVEAAEIPETAVSGLAGGAIREAVRFGRATVKVRPSVSN